MTQDTKLLDDAMASRDVMSSVTAASDYIPILSGGVLKRALGTVVAAALAATVGTSLIASSITNGDTTHAPSGDAVYDALALKADQTTLAGYYTSSQTDTLLAANYQPLDSDLTSWAAITRASGFDTFVATPTSANLLALITNETGSGSLVFATGPTLSAPVFSTIVNTGTLTLPTSTDTLVGRATTDTLTNKTLSSAAMSGTFSGSFTLSGTVTFTLAPVFTDASGSRTALGLGTAAVKNTGTSGNTVPLLDGANTWSADQTLPTTKKLYFNSHGDGTGMGSISGSTSSPYDYLDIVQQAGSGGWSGGIRFYTNNNAGANTLVLSLLNNGGAPTASSASAWTFSGGLTSTTDVTISKATPTLYLVGTSTNIPEIQLQNASRYDGVRNTTSGMSFRYDISGTPKEMLWNGTSLTLNAVTVVTTSSSDTLTNKTLSSPTLSGTVAGTPTWASAQTFPHSTTVTAASGITTFIIASVNGGGNYGGSVRFTDTGSGGVLSEIRSIANGGFHWLINGTVTTILTTSAYYPFSDNTLNLGGSSNRWATVYAATGTINTSDMTEKTPFRAANDNEFAFAREVFREAGWFKWLSAVESKGDRARTHFGLGAQNVETTAERYALTPTALGFFCQDAIDGGVLKGLRPDQLHTLGIAALFEENEQLRRRVEELERKVA